VLLIYSVDQCNKIVRSDVTVIVNATLIDGL